MGLSNQIVTVLIRMVESNVVVVGMVGLEVVDQVILCFGGMALVSKDKGCLGTLGFLVMMGLQCLASK